MLMCENEEQLVTHFAIPLLADLRNEENQRDAPDKW
jgi:hypothetical protein